MLSACPTVWYKMRCLMPPLSSVLVPLCMLGILQINVNTCGQKIML